MITAALVLSSLIGPTLVHSCRDGLAVNPGVLVSAWQEEGLMLGTSGTLLGREWCSHDLVNCVEDVGQGCPTDECTHVLRMFAHQVSVIWPDMESGVVTHFAASDQKGNVRFGVWCGPSDYNLDGVRSMEDYDAFLSQFWSGDADYNMDGAVDSADYFDFLTDFFAV